MKAPDLKSARRDKGWSQTEAATRLGVSQTYLSMLEAGKRRLRAPLSRKAKRVFNLPATALPLSDDWEAEPQTGMTLVEQVAALGYPGFTHLRQRHWRKNPAEVLLTALAQKDLESRLVEALPWVLVQYSDMDRNWLVQHAKQFDLQNRLGFVASLARQVAAKTTVANSPSVAALSSLLEPLEQCRLARQDTLGKSLLSDAERRWLEDNRPEEAAHWNLLTDWRAETLPYAGQPRAAAMA
jgi:transcriptional regulator with XRE-family HTH domain